MCHRRAQEREEQLHVGVGDADEVRQEVVVVDEVRMDLESPRQLEGQPRWHQQARRHLDQACVLLHQPLKLLDPRAPVIPAKEPDQEMIRGATQEPQTGDAVGVVAHHLERDLHAQRVAQDHRARHARRVERADRIGGELGDGGAFWISRTRRPAVTAIMRMDDCAVEE